MPARRRDRPKHLRRRDAVINDTSEVAARRLAATTCRDAEWRQQRRKFRRRPQRSSRMDGFANTQFLFICRRWRPWRLSCKRDSLLPPNLSPEYAGAAFPHGPLVLQASASLLQPCNPSTLLFCKPALMESRSFSATPSTAPLPPDKTVPMVPKAIGVLGRFTTAMTEHSISDHGQGGTCAQPGSSTSIRLGAPCGTI